MRVFVALAFACGAMAAAVQPLDIAAEANGILSVESDLQDAVVDIDAASEWAGPEGTDEAEALAKRAGRPQIYLKSVPIPRPQVNGGAPAPIEFMGVRVDYLMAQRQYKEGNRMVLKSYVHAVRVTNQGAKRLVTGTEIGTASTRVTGKPFFSKVMSRGDTVYASVASDLILFRLSVKAAQ
ncbi:hypothetical protein E4U14_000940 [Claviceps sp. LM454 group G7]|nr:hypothetical protein E4U14_000940 [Claviceps sp. LM454 group G7]